MSYCKENSIEFTIKNAALNFKKAVVLPDMPKEIKIELSSECNLSCIFSALIQN